MKINWARGFKRDYLKTCSHRTISCISIIWFKFTVSVIIDTVTSCLLSLRIHSFLDASSVKANRRAPPESGWNCVLSTPATAELPTELHVLALLGAPLHPSSSRQLLSSLWTRCWNQSSGWLLSKTNFGFWRLSNRPIMSPHFGNNPSQMCARLITFPIRAASPHGDYAPEIKGRRTQRSIEALLQTQQGAEII